MGETMNRSQQCHASFIEKHELNVALIKSLICYDSESGSLSWKERSADLFWGGAAFGGADGVAKRWNFLFAGKKISRVNNKGYVEVSIFGKSFKGHKIAWAIYYGEFPENHIDHINGVRSDNRIENLRSVTVAENMKNKRRYANNKSGLTGVCFCSTKKVWVANANVNGKRVHLGSFKQKADAILARMAFNVDNFHQNHGNTLPPHPAPLHTGGK